MEIGGRLRKSSRKEHGLGVVLGADGTLRLMPGLGAHAQM